MGSNDSFVELQIRLYKYNDKLNIAEFIKKKGCLVNFYEVSKNFKENLYETEEE